MNRIAGDLPVGAPDLDKVVIAYVRSTALSARISELGLVLVNLLAAAAEGRVQRIQGPGILPRADEARRSRALDQGRLGPPGGLPRFLRQALLSMTPRGQDLFPDLMFYLRSSAEFDLTIEDLWRNEALITRLREQLGEADVELRSDGLEVLYERLAAPLLVPMRTPRLFTLAEWMRGTSHSGDPRLMLGSWLQTTWAAWSEREVRQAIGELARARV